MSSVPQGKINKDEILKILDTMQEQIEEVRKSVEFDKKIKPYFFMLNMADEQGALKTNTLGNFDILSIIGLLETSKLSYMSNRK